MPPPDSRRGFALLTALWAIVILGALAVEFHTAASTDRATAANVRASARARWAARAGLARAIETLDRTLGAIPLGRDISPSGDTVLAPLAFEIDGVSVRVIALDARARLHLNRAEHRELELLMGAAGLEPIVADSLADAILDWRDADGLHRARGAEAPQYLTLRPPARPRDGPFANVDELRSVWGMTAERYRATAPHLTLAGDGRINVNSASMPVLRTLPGMDAEAVETILRRRARAPYRNIFDLLASVPQPARARMQGQLGALTDRVAFSPREVEIAVSATVRGSPVTARLDAVALLSGGKTLSIVRVVER